MESNIFEMNYGSRHKEIATWKGVRIGYVNELSKKMQDENVIKELADGTSMRYKVMYGAMDTMPITLKLWIVGNSTMKINADAGIKRRLKMLQFDSEFVADLKEDDPANCQFIKDTRFGMLLQTQYKYALMELIYQYSKKYVDNKYSLCKYPDEWMSECEDVVNDNNKFEEYFYNHFDIDANGSVSKPDVDAYVEEFVRKEKEQIVIKDELKKMKIKYTYDCKTRAAKQRTRGIYHGFKLAVVVSNDEDLTDDEGETTQL